MNGHCHSSIGIALLLLGVGSLAQAQVENTPQGSVYIEGYLCVSDNTVCGPSEVIAMDADLKIKDGIPVIYFENTFNQPNDEIEWYIRTDLDQFQIFDHGVNGSRNNSVFQLRGAAPANSLVVQSSGNIGLGTNNPGQAVDVERSGNAARFQLTAYTDNATQAPQYIQRRARGTSQAPGVIQNNDNLGLFSFRGYNGTQMTGSRAVITAQAAGNWTGVSNPTRLTFGTTPVGSTTVQTVLEITPDAKVKINGSTLNVPDYVFEDDYELMPLEQLRSFIDENGHLPGIAPAHEVNANGLDLAGSQMGQLQKIEELTLYTLQQEARIEQQDARIEQLEAQLAQVLARLE